MPLSSRGSEEKTVVYVVGRQAASTDATVHRRDPGRCRVYVIAEESRLECHHERAFLGKLRFKNIFCKTNFPGLYVSAEFASHQRTLKTAGDPAHSRQHLHSPTVTADMVTNDSRGSGDPVAQYDTLLTLLKDGNYLHMMKWMQLRIRHN